LSIGRTKQGDVKNHTIYDTFDVNTIGTEAQRDNEMYKQGAQNNPGLTYARLRASMPSINMIDIIPDQYKINSAIRL
jgi:hypothetical protein